MPPLAGERWWRQPPKGDAFPRPAGRLYGFRRQRRYKKWRRRRRTSPVGTVSQPIGKPFNGQAKGLLWLTWRSYAGPPQCYIPPEGGSPQTACKAKPFTGRTLAAQSRQARRRHQPSPAGRQPSGIQLPADSSQRPITSNVAHSKKAPVIRLVLLS